MYVIRWTIAVFALYCTTVKACAENETCEIDLNDQNVKALLAGMEAFTDKLLRTIYTDDFVEGNIALSPLSIYFSLALMLLGSTDKTLALLDGALGFPKKADPQVLQDSLKSILDNLEVNRSEMVDSEKVVNENASLGQALFYQNTLQLQDTYQKFLDLIGAEYFNVDFTAPKEALKTIQDWVATQTSADVNVGASKPFPETSEILFGSTVFFTAKWKDGLFPKDKHGTGDFYSLPQKKIIQVGIMKTSSASTFQYLDVPGDYSCLQIPYKGEENTLLIVLPYKENDIGKFVQYFDMSEYKYIIENSGPEEANVTIPKFMGVWTGTIGRYLIKMGLGDLFQDAQLGNMIQDFIGGLEVTELLHAAAMELDESGTTVSTISTQDVITPDGDVGAGVSMGVMQVEPMVELAPIEFVVDRPFLVFIHNIKTGLPLFAALMRNLEGN